MSRQILVLGGYGAVGQPLVRELASRGYTPIVGGRDARRAERVVDARDEGSLRAALRDVDLVINASGLEQPMAVEVVTACGIPFVDITATTSYVQAIEQMQPEAPVVLSVGLAPGLTNLLAKALHQRGSDAMDAAEAIDLVVLLGAGEQHGAAATNWSYEHLGRHFIDPGSGQRVRNYTQARDFELPGLGRWRARRLDFSEQHTLSRDLGVPVRSYFTLDVPIALTLLSALTWLPGARRLPRDVPPMGSDRWLCWAGDTRGRALWAAGNGQSRATALMTAMAVDKLETLPAGVHHLHRFLGVEDLQPLQGIELHLE